MGVSGLRAHRTAASPRVPATTTVPSGTRARGPPPATPSCASMRPSPWTVLGVPAPPERRLPRGAVRSSRVPAARGRPTCRRPCSVPVRCRPSSAETFVDHAYPRPSSARRSTDRAAVGRRTSGRGASSEGTPRTRRSAPSARGCAAVRGFARSHGRRRLRRRPRRPRPRSGGAVSLWGQPALPTGRRQPSRLLHVPPRRPSGSPRPSLPPTGEAPTRRISQSQSAVR